MEWDAVVEYDPFFEDVKLIKSVSEFAEKIEKDRVLSVLDVAKYIYSKTKCNSSSLDRFVCLAYADYSREHPDSLFEDDDYKQSNFRGCIDVTIVEPPARSRILFAKNGMAKLSSIDRVIQRYSEYS